MKWALFLIIVFIVAVVIINGVAIKKDARIITMPLPGDRQAITMPPFGIFVEKEFQNNLIVIKHEECHWRQYQKKGLLNFYADYIKLKRRHSYQDNPMESECFISQNQ